MQETADGSAVELDVAAGKYLDSTLIKADVQPSYVRLLIKVRDLTNVIRLSFDRCYETHYVKLTIICRQICTVSAQDVYKLLSKTVFVLCFGKYDEATLLKLH